MAGIRTPDLQEKTTLDDFIGNKDSGVGSETVRVSAAAAAAQLRTLIMLDSVVLGVKDKDIATPPGSPSVGDRYIVAASPTGAWVGHATHIAQWDGTAWAFTTPSSGYTVLVIDEFELYAWNATTSKWTTITSAPLAFATRAALGAVTGVPANVKAEVLSDVIGTTVSRARSANVATNVFASNHSLSVGNEINIRGLGGAGYNGHVTIASVPNATTITYASTGGNETTVADFGGSADRNGVYSSNGAGGWTWVGDPDVAAVNLRIDELVVEMALKAPIDTAPKPLADPDYALVVEDISGNVALRIRKDGVSDWASAIDATKVYLYSARFGRAFSVPLASTGTPLGSAVHGSKLQYLLNVGGVPTPYVEWAESEHNAPLATTQLNLYLTYGQSLSMGDKGAPVLTSQSTSYRSRLLSYNNGVMPIDKYADLTALNETISDDSIRRLVNVFERTQGVAGQTIATTFLTRVAAALPSTTALAVAGCGIGATTIAQLSKGTTPYSNLLRVVRRTFVLAKMNGWAFKVPAIAFKQGESNSTSSQASYYAAIVQLQSDLTTDIQGITGQSEQVVIVLTQHTSWGLFGATQGTVAKAQQQAALAFPTKFINAGPDYSIPHATDKVHLTNVGYYRVGELIGRALADSMGANVGLSLYPTSAVRTGTNVLVTFHVPTTSIVLDTSTWPDAGNMGIRWIDNGDGNAPVIQSVTVTAANQLTVALDVAPTGTGPKLGFGDLTTSGTGSDIGVGPRTNIRDSSADVSAYDAAPLRNWCVVSDINVT